VAGNIFVETFAEVGYLGGDPLRGSVIWVRKLRLAAGGERGCCVGVIADANALPHLFAADPVTQIVAALRMRLRRAFDEAPVGTETLLGLPRLQDSRVGSRR
jgi:hypothetical protein